MYVLIYFVDEVDFCGSVVYRWIFYVERYLKVLKFMIRQQVKSEGSLVMGYLVKEVMFFAVSILCKWIGMFFVCG